MKTWGLVRIGALLITVGFVHTTLFSSWIRPNLGSYIFYAWVNVIFFSHYILAHTTPATFRRLKDLTQTKSGAISLVLITMAVVASLNYSHDLGVIYSSIHLSISEVYSRMAVDNDRQFYSDQRNPVRFFRFLHWGLLFLVFFTATYHTFIYTFSLNFVTHMISLPTLNVALAVFAFGYFLMLATQWKRIFPQRSFSEVGLAYVIPEILFIGMTVACQVYQIHWSALVLYHVNFWLVFPFLKCGDRTALLNTIKFNVVPTIAITILFVYFYPGPGQGTPLTAEDYATVNIPQGTTPFAGLDSAILSKEVLWAYGLTLSFGIFHTLSSLVLSNLNPSFLRNLTARRSSAISH